MLMCFRYTQIWFGLRCMFPTWRDWDIQYTRKGLVRRATSRTLRTLGLIAFIMSVVSIRRSADGRGVKAVIRETARSVLLKSAGFLQSIGSNV